MPQNNQDNGNTKTTRRRKKPAWLAAVIVVLAALLAHHLLTRRTVEEKLAAIEAARAIPDSENAAFIYDELLEDYNASALSPEFLDPNADDLTRRELWSAEDYPKLAEWIKQQRGLMKALLEAATKDKCRFAIYDPGEGIKRHLAKRMPRIKAMRKWAYLLVRTANNDVGEGRIDQALEKYYCTVRMGEHGRQQPIALDYLTGISMEALALQQMRHIIIAGNITEERLGAIEAVLPSPNHNWAEDSKTMLEVERLYSKELPSEKYDSLLKQIKAWIRRPGEEAATINYMHDLYLRLFADRRGNRILVALRRYKNKHDRWPQSLDEIKSSLPEKILKDPQNGDPFVYRLTDGGFILYGKGKNNVDDKGIKKGRLDDRLIWPPKMPMKKQENADDK